MSRPTYSGEDIIKALEKWRFQRVGQRGSHVKLRFKDRNTGEIRTVVVPLHDEISTGTLKNISEQAGANDFQEFLDALEDLV